MLSPSKAISCNSLHSKSALSLTERGIYGTVTL